MEDLSQGQTYPTLFPDTPSLLPAQVSKSFAVGMFKGQLTTDQVFPYPSGKEMSRQTGAGTGSFP